MAQPITKAEFLALLKNRIAAVDIESARQDIIRFIRDANVLDIWSPEYFLALADKLQIIAKETEPDAHAKITP